MKLVMVTVEVEVKLQVAFSGSEGHGIDIGVPRDAFGLRTRERQRFRDFLTSNCSLLVSRTSLVGLGNIRGMLETMDGSSRWQCLVPLSKLIAASRKHWPAPLSPRLLVTLLLLFGPSKR